jgi:GT2 family glycosyltransferase
MSIVTIIVVTWNRRECVIELLNSLQHLNYHDSNIVIVDNASTDGSAEAIRNHPQPVILIENPENLGGTGGFNTGVRYALENLDQEYIWLLDNDVTVDPDALISLVRVMENNETIGFAGSKILNAFDSRYIVETGAFVEWSTASVRPLNRNIPDNGNIASLYDVDYTAICSALLRVESLRRVGIMDERYFLLWDDMDWGLSFREAGFRVVAVSDSIVFHPPFTEKRSVAVDNYYGIRNPLLTASKRAKGFQRILGVLSICRRACRIYLMTGLDGQSYGMKLCMEALKDFLLNRWGKLTLPQPSTGDNGADCTGADIAFSSLNGRILILNSGSTEIINKVIRLLRSNCSSQITIDVVVQKDRVNLVERQMVDTVIPVDFDGNNVLVRNALAFARILLRRYSLAINPSDNRTSPFSQAAKQLARYDDSTGKLLFQKKRSVLVLGVGILLAEAVAVVVSPIFWLRGLFYGIKSRPG